MNQRIVCAANRHKQTKQIILGIRHWDGYMRVQCFDYDYSDYEQGFIDNKGNFLTREEAWVVAKSEGQIIRRVGGDEGCLYSENLYQEYLYSLNTACQNDYLTQVVQPQPTADKTQRGLFKRGLEL